MLLFMTANIFQNLFKHPNFKNNLMSDTAQKQVQFNITSDAFLAM